MRIAVFGATGFVASRLIEHLLSDPAHSVIAAARRPESLPLHDRIEVRRMEAGDAAAIHAALEGADAAVNCIMGTAQAMLESTRNLAEAARRRHLPRLVHISSIAVFGDREGLVDEDASQAAGDWYGQAKIGCEEMVGALMRDGLDVITLRPALIYGPGSALWTTRIARLLRARRLGDLGERGDGYCDLVHLDEVAAAIVAALKLPGVSGQSYNLANPAPPTWNAYLMAFARALGAVPLRRIPGWQLTLERKIAAPLLRMGEIGLGRLGAAALVPPPITPGLARLLTRRARYHSGRADMLLAGQRIDWREAILEQAGRDRS